MIPLSPFTFYFLLINNNNNNNNNRAWTPKKHKGMLVLSLSFSFIFFLLLYRVSNANIAVGSFHVSCNLLLMFFWQVLFTILLVNKRLLRLLIQRRDWWLQQRCVKFIPYNLPVHSFYQSGYSIFFFYIAFYSYIVNFCFV